MGVQTEKLHAACDECRTRKLKCSGESPTCSRCERETLKCVYSPQKQMGRPRKRRREDGPSEQAQESQPDTSAITSGLPVPILGDDGSMPHTNLTMDFPGFEGMPLHNVFCNAMVPPTYADSFGDIPTYDTSHGIDPIDPLLWGNHPDDSGFNSQTNSTPGPQDNTACSCLSLMYLSLSDLQSLNNFSFPAGIARIRPTLATASTIVHCPKCPLDVFSAIQNIQSLNSLLSAIAQRFHKVLTAIDEEAARLEQAGEKKSFRVGDNSPQNAHLHTGTTDCPMGYDLNLDPQDWRKLAKLALKTEVWGGGRNPMPFMKVIEELEKRQTEWHFDTSNNYHERAKLFGVHNMPHDRNGDVGCLRTITQVRAMVDSMDWS